MVTTKSGQSATKVDRPTLADEAERDEVIAGLRQCLDELREQAKALTAELTRLRALERGIEALVRVLEALADD